MERWYSYRDFRIKKVPESTDNPWHIFLRFSDEAVDATATLRGAKILIDMWKAENIEAGR